jgi:hypothetical protein
VEYCTGQTSHNDVLGVLEASKPEVAGAAVTIRSTEDTIGFVYLLKAGGYFKIGRSSSFERRSRELAIQLPERAERVHVCVCVHARVPA